jgi:hypothetical protein
MTTTEPPVRARVLTAKALGVLAVIGMVIAFSLSSTLVKRAESPGVLVAFWRMLTFTVFGAAGSVLFMLLSGPLLARFTLARSGPAFRFGAHRAGSRR